VQGREGIGESGRRATDTPGGDRITLQCDITKVPHVRILPIGEKERI
jgi:hypothetical protein